MPPVANFKEVDPELGPLNLSKGGVYPVEYALRLGAGFGSQISMTLMRWVATKDGVRPSPNALGYTYRIADPNCLERLARAGWRAIRPRIWKWCTARCVCEIQGRRPAEPLRVAARVACPRPVAASAMRRRQRRIDVPEPPVLAATCPSDEPARDPVKERILALVAEKTGYPLDMLDLDLDLEADLGVDTVKQAEMFAAIREIYNIPRDENLKLRDFPTLAHVIRFVHDRRPDLAACAAAAGQRRSQTVDRRASRRRTGGRKTPVHVKERILALVAEKTGYPKDMLDLDLDLEADLGVDTVKQAEMFAAIREIYNIPRDENLQAARFPDTGARDPVRIRQAARPGRRRCRRCQRRGAPAPAEPHRRRSRLAATDDPSRTKCWRSWPRRPAIPRTCWTWTRSGSGPRHRHRQAGGDVRRRCARPTTFRATRT